MNNITIKKQGITIILDKDVFISNGSMFGMDEWKKKHINAAFKEVKSALGQMAERIEEDVNEILGNYDTGDE